MDINNPPSALILMSTYQGESFITAQLDSLLAQTYANWRLIIRDDHSSDNTTSIIKEYINRDSRIHLIEDPHGNIHIQKSFSILMQYALTQPHDYIFFCDQDDVWLPEKLAKQINQLSDMQKCHGTDTPLLVHSDLQVVNQNLKLIHPSYLAFEKILRNTISPLHTLLINNFVTGCTLGMNKALLKIATPIPETAIMHDWWCALCAAAYGRIAFLNEATILYRQHDKNSVGSKGFYYRLWIQLRNGTKTLAIKKNNFRRCFVQAKDLLNRKENFNPEQEVIKKFSDLINLNIYSRYSSALALKIKGVSQLRSLLFFGMLGLL